MKIIDKLRNLDENNRIILKNTGGAFAVKGASLVISFLTTPAFIRYFNNDVLLGVWYTLLSVLIWFLNFDLGIGNGIRNNLVRAFGNRDRGEAKRIISSGVVSITAVSLLLTLAGTLALFTIDLNWLFNVSPEMISGRALLMSAVCVFLSIMLRFCLTTVSSVFYALQKSAVNNFLSLCVSVLQLLFVLIVHFDDPERALTALSVAYLLISNLPVLVAAVVVFSTSLKDCRPNLRYVDRTRTKEILNIGGIFFFCQICYMLIANTNEFLITKLFAPEYTTLYSFYYKIASLSSMVITLAMTPVWSIVTKALVEKNFVWLNSLYKKIKLVGIGAVAVQFLSVPLIQIIMNLWLGRGTVEVDYLIAVAFACFGSAFVYSGMLSTVVCGMSRMKLQAICYAAGVVFKLAFCVIAAKFFTVNWSIVVWSNAIILIPYCVAQQIDLNRYFKKRIREGAEKE